MRGLFLWFVFFVKIVIFLERIIQTSRLFFHLLTTESQNLPPHSIRAPRAPPKNGRNERFANPNYRWWGQSSSIEIIFVCLIIFFSWRISKMALLQLIMKLISLFRRKNLRLHQISFKFFMWWYLAEEYFSLFTVFSLPSHAKPSHTVSNHESDIWFEVTKRILIGVKMM